MRQLSCEPGMKSCHRVLHKWFYREREQKSDGATLSILDGEDDEDAAEERRQMRLQQGHDGSIGDDLSLNTYQNSLVHYGGAVVPRQGTAEQPEYQDPNKPEDIYLPLFHAGQGEEEG